MAQPRRNNAWKDPLVAEEIRRVQDSFEYFLEHYVCIHTKRHGILKPPKYPGRARKSRTWQVNTAQRVVIKLFEDGKSMIAILKARQLGYSTIIAAYNFWRGYFSTDRRTLILAQQDEPAAYLLESKYKTIYEHLPAALKWPVVVDNTYHFRTANGWDLRAFTASTKAFNAFTYDDMHLSEMAKWERLDETMSELGPCWSGRGAMISETTPSGLGPYADFYMGDTGWEKVFVPWTSETDYALPKPTAIHNAAEKAYIKAWGLSKQQASWYVFTLRAMFRGDQRVFNTQYPISKDVAFAATGDPFFLSPTFVEKPYKNHLGLRQYRLPGHDRREKLGRRLPFHIYTIGVDTATGSLDGDFSAYAVLDVTDKRIPRAHVVETFCARISTPEFKVLVHKACERWEALAVVEKTGGYGLPVIDYLIEKQYPWQYRTVRADSTNKKFRGDAVGWNTLSSASGTGSRWIMLNRLSEWLSKRWLDIGMDVRATSQAATFIYVNEGNEKARRVRPRHAESKHDDLLFALALALMGLDQIHEVEDRALSQRPSTINDILRWERVTGRRWNRKADPDVTAEDDWILDIIQDHFDLQTLAL